MSRWIPGFLGRRRRRSNERWFAHLACFNSPGLEAAGELDTTCVVCGDEVDERDRNPQRDRDEVRNVLGIGTGPPSPLDQMMFAMEAATCAWQCQRCARWQCNRCVCAALAEGGIPIPDHAGCGGQFAPPP
jgi:hypothetical protein